MNIFRLDNDPELAAQYLEDKHTMSQLQEAALMLSTVLRQNGHNDEYLYGSTHQNHPCTVWVGEGRENFAWLYDLAEACFEEKEYRYGPGHSSWEDTVALMPREPECLPEGGTLQPLVGGATDYVKGPNAQSFDGVVRAYRQHYFDSEREFSRARDPPEWATPPEVTADD